LTGLSWAWPTLMATAIQITSCLTQARDRRRYGILTTTFSAPACLGPLFLPAEAQRFQIVSSAPRAIGSVATSWNIVGAADFNGDGPANIL
jgi:hypothetical protein